MKSSFARAKKMAIEAEKLTGDNIYKVLIYFDKLYSVMDDQEKRQLMESLLSEVQIYEERQSNGQWLKSIKFKLPIIAEDMSFSLDNDTHIDGCERDSWITGNKSQKRMGGKDLLFLKEHKKRTGLGFPLR